MLGEHSLLEEPASPADEVLTATHNKHFQEPFPVITKSPIRQVSIISVVSSSPRDQNIHQKRSRRFIKDFMSCKNQD